MGDTCTGRKGKKYRSPLNGAKSATPRPPFVSMSSAACDAAASEKKAASALRFGASRKKASVTETPSKRAKASECVKPRWPNMLPYGTPKPNARTSASGTTAHSTASVQKRAGTRPRAYAPPIAAAKKACVKAEATEVEGKGRRPEFRS